MSNTKTAGKVRVTPIGDRVLVRPSGMDNVETTKSGIYIPETVQKEKPEEGEVIAVGEGFYQEGKLIPLRVKIGDKVVFSKYGYDEVKIDGKEYFILKQDSILAIIN